jgi:hypothetical protein
MWEGRKALHKAPLLVDLTMILEERSSAPEAVEGAAPGKELSPAARRALAEAAERRRKIDARAAELRAAKEHQGRNGLDPVRYEDWEVKGLATDF